MARPIGVGRAADGGEVPHPLQVSSAAAALVLRILPEGGIGRAFRWVRCTHPTAARWLGQAEAAAFSSSDRIERARISSGLPEAATGTSLPHAW